MLALRSAAVGLSILAWANFALPLPTRERTVVVLIDVSDSIGRAGIEASRNAALALIRSLNSRDRAAAAVFAGGTATLFHPEASEKAATLLEAANLSLPSSGSTDIAASLAAAGELASEGPGAANIYLFSDGRSNSGSPATSPRPRGFSAAVWTIAAGEAKTGLSSAGLEVPGLVREGERAVLTWRLVSDSPRTIGYALSLDGRPISRGTASLRTGANELRLEMDAGASGTKALSIEAEEAGSRPLVASGAFLEVEGPPSVIVVSASVFGAEETRGSPLSRAFETQGVKVVSGGPELLSETAAGYAGVAAVVLDDMPALAITEAQQDRLRDYVAEGGGLLVVGGESSLGRGEYYATPLEEMLPVETDSRRRLQFTRAKLLFVIDHSGSMAEEVGGTTKKIAAIRGIAAAIARLNPLDEVGVIAFDTMASWVAPFTPAQEKNKIMDALSVLSDGSGTDLAAGILEAVEGFGPPGPTKRHVVILTDGLTADADFPDLAARLVAVGATASTIAIGDTVNEELLKDFAERCGGEYYRAEGDKIPTVIDEETIRMTRELIQEGRIETRVVSSSAMVEGLRDPLPRLGGYLRTSAKALAAVEIEAKGEDSEGIWDPLLASWRYGNGRTAVFTSDSGARWLSAWSSLSDYNRLWIQALRSVERAAPDGALRPRTILEGGGARVVVDAVGRDRRSLSSLRLVAKVQGEGGSFPLKETAPGRYEGFVPVAGEGLFGIDVFDTVSRSRCFTWAWKDDRSESPGLGPDRTALSLIASANGGELVGPERPEAPIPKTVWTGHPLRPLLLGFAAFLLLADLFLRSTMAGQLERALAAGMAWWSRQRADAESYRHATSEEGVSGTDPEREARAFELQRRLAERVADRNAPSAKDSVSPEEEYRG